MSNAFFPLIAFQIILFRCRFGEENVCSRPRVDDVKPLNSLPVKPDGGLNQAVLILKCKWQTLVVALYRVGYGVQFTNKTLLIINFKGQSFKVVAPQ